MEKKLISIGIVLSVGIIAFADPIAKLITFGGL